jgi:TonB family protein
MKTKFLSLLLLPLLGAPAFAIKQAPDVDRPLVVVKRQVEPLFPRSLLDLGVTTGEARVVMSIDSTGKVVDYLVIGYTHPDIAPAVVAAIKKWEFEPPTFRGEPVSVLREVQFDFESRGAVVTMDVTTYVMQRALTFFAERYTYRPCSLKELDKIPTPIAAQAPLYPETMARERRAGSTTVEFFIDETGAVRMPSVVNTDHSDFAVSAVIAVKDWKFEPPTRNGRPVLLRAQQTFTFTPEKASK